MVEALQSKELASIPNPPLGDLTFREWEVLLLISEDKSNDEIASHSNMKVNSIRTMRNRIGDKLMLKGRHKLGHFARKYRQELHDLFPILYPPRKILDKKSGNNK